MELDGGSCEKNMSAKMSRNTLEKSIFISRENTEKTNENKNFSFSTYTHCCFSVQHFKYFLELWSFSNTF